MIEKKSALFGEMALYRDEMIFDRFATNCRKNNGSHHSVLFKETVTKCVAIQSQLEPFPNASITVSLAH